MSSELPATLTNSSLPASELNLPPRADFSLLSPSARTSFTRVDVGAEDDVDGGEGAEENGQASAEDIADGVQAEDEAQHEPAVPQIPQVSLTFLLVSGRRRTMTFEPETTVGRVKELVWNAWPNGTSHMIIATFLGYFVYPLYSVPADFRPYMPPSTPVRYLSYSLSRRMAG